MQIPPYRFSSDSNRLFFSFQSVSDTKTVQKLVEYSLLEDNMYNLFLGDVDEAGNVSDLSVSDNNDMEKVLATVVSTMFEFFDRYPNTTVYFSGSTATRTRLYRIAISKYKNEFDEFFVIYGVFEEQLESFTKGRNYDGFIIALKERM